MLYLVRVKINFSFTPFFFDLFFFIANTAGSVIMFRLFAYCENFTDLP